MIMAIIEQMLKQAERCIKDFLNGENPLKWIWRKEARFVDVTLQLQLSGNKQEENLVLSSMLMGWSIHGIPKSKVMVAAEVSDERSAYKWLRS